MIRESYESQDVLESETRSTLDSEMKEIEDSSMKKVVDTVKRRKRPIISKEERIKARSEIKELGLSDTFQVNRYNSNKFYSFEG